MNPYFLLGTTIKAMKLNYLPLLNFDNFHADHKDQWQNVSTIHPHPSTNIFRMFFSSWYSRKDRAGCTEALRWALDASGGQMPLLAFKLYQVISKNGFPNNFLAKIETKTKNKDWNKILFTNITNPQRCSYQKLVIARMLFLTK